MRSARGQKRSGSGSNCLRNIRIPKQRLEAGTTDSQMNSAATGSRVTRYLAIGLLVVFAATAIYFAVNQVRITAPNFTKESDFVFSKEPDLSETAVSPYLTRM